MKVSEIYDYALTYFGMPYQWGGTGDRADIGVFGVDCSGLIQRIGKFGGIVFPHDMTSQEIFDMAKAEGWKKSSEMGAWAFFGLSGKVSHVGFMIDNRCMISAAGGGSWCNTLKAATDRNASVKIQPVAVYRYPSLVGIYFPKYA